MILLLCRHWMQEVNMSLKQDILLMLVMMGYHHERVILILGKFELNLKCVLLDYYYYYLIGKLHLNLLLLIF